MLSRASIVAGAFGEGGFDVRGRWPMVARRVNKTDDVSSAAGVTAPGPAGREEQGAVLKYRALMTDIRYVTNEPPGPRAMHELMASAWGCPSGTRWDRILQRSLCWVCAYHDERLVGFVNVAWDGGVHASIFDTSVHKDYQKQGVGTMLLRHAIVEAGARGAEWLHVDFEPHLEGFYARVGFRSTTAGLLRLVEPR
ncbi:GNAT family N-acetyltransferase [Deinococcus pimensis]|uniref:GNAT family N-acetyltransferase n=1 Tax=Deinococcus pimensis TaxID=309888 RepID=UPI001B7F824C|nr:GNAT family N-acetyltransferase [Deinococcus pimensis]